jgi:hypothetical protein
MAHVVGELRWDPEISEASELAFSRPEHQLVTGTSFPRNAVKLVPGRGIGGLIVETTRE